MQYFQILLLLGINFSTLLLGQSIEIPHKMMKKDVTLNVPIFIYDVSNLESIQLKIEYNETIVNALEIIKNPVGILDDGYIFTTNISESGIIHIGIGSNSTNVFSGSGMVAQISIQAIGQLGDFSPLTFSDAQINSELVLEESINGSIEIILDELTITAVDQSGIGSDDFIILGMCETCTDGWRYGEDEYNTPNPQSAYTDIYFFNLDWYGQTDINDNICDKVRFTTDYRKQHSATQLVSWGISGSTDGLPSDTPIILSWVSSNSDNYKMFLYIGDEDGIDMQLQNNINISQSELNNGSNGPNIWVKVGICADTGETITYYQDFDGDGFGSSISEQFCTGYVPDGWVANSDDEDDYCYSNQYDCFGDCDGTAIEDCNGECGGSAIEDECDECGGSGPELNYDCDGNCIVEIDCFGECAGTAEVDECGICDGPGATPDCGCSDIPDGFCDCEGNELDECDVCNGQGAIYGDTGCCEFETDECGICGGMGIADGDCDCDGNIYDECGICGGIGIADGDCDCEGHKLDECGDCVGVDVFDYNENMDIFGTCCSFDEKDICGECGGIGIADGDCDCDGNVLDCAGECGGSALKDNCGICNGDNSSCTDCNNIINGEAYIDGCGDCVGGNTGNVACQIDCNNNIDGEAYIDGCGECDDNPDNDCIQDCNGVWGGNAIIDDCEICVGGSTDIEPCVMDCAEVLGGTFWVSDCGCVEADNSGDECDDCAGIPNGLAEIDNCGNCIEDSTDSGYECEPDCDGIYGGNHPPTFACQNGEVACNYDACFDLESIEVQLPQKFDISRIYPNPFNPQTTIDFEVSEPAMVQLNIYNLNGQKVDVLKNAFILPGNYSVSWNGTDHPSGIYFVILYSSSSVIKQKIMLIK